MPVIGASSRPVRLRPPSMKYSIECPRAMIAARYFMNTTVYNELPRKLRRMKKPPPLRRNRPITGRLRLTPGGHVRHRKAVLVDRVGQQQVVHVAAMARHVDDFVAVGHLPQRVDMAELDAVVQPVPHARQQMRHGTDEGVRIVGGDLVDATARLEQQLAAASAVAVARRLRHRLAHRA
jgi:hypothetical protein